MGDIGCHEKLNASLGSFVAGNSYDTDESVRKQCAKVCLKIYLGNFWGLTLLLLLSERSK